jgi:hypothetical protein
MSPIILDIQRAFALTRVSGNYGVAPLLRDKGRQNRVECSNCHCAAGARRHTVRVRPAGVEPLQGGQTTEGSDDGESNIPAVIRSICII